MRNLNITEQELIEKWGHGVAHAALDFAKEISLVTPKDMPTVAQGISQWLDGMWADQMKNS